MVDRAVQAAAIRRRIRIPLRFADGYSTTSTVISFTGLTDARQHERITKHGGYVLYMQQEGRDIGLYDKLDAYDRYHCLLPGHQGPARWA